MLQCRNVPKIWDSFHAHGLNDFSQSGCKLAMYTAVGMPHVVTFLVLMTVIYALFVMKRGSSEDADSWVRNKFGWLVVFLFAFEGATGMVPAIYTDVAHDYSECGQTAGLSIVSTETARSV